MLEAVVPAVSDVLVEPLLDVELEADVLVPLVPLAPVAEAEAMHSRSEVRQISEPGHWSCASHRTAPL